MLKFILAFSALITTGLSASTNLQQIATERLSQPISHTFNEWPLFSTISTSEPDSPQLPSSKNRLTFDNLPYFNLAYPDTTKIIKPLPLLNLNDMY